MSKIKCIIHISDVHFRTFRRHEEYEEQLMNKFIDDCKKITSEYGKEHVRIIIVGDLFHQKIVISNEVILKVSEFIKKLDQIATTIVIAGNHDLLENNKDRIDSITPIFTLSDFNESIYIDKELNYKSGCIADENIVWVLYSIFDDLKRPDFEIHKHRNNDKLFIGLFHGAINNSLTDTNYNINKGYDGSIFEDLDLVLCGDIHKRQDLRVNGVDIHYPGSIIQQDYGENISGHGYTIWTIDDENHINKKTIDLVNDYGFCIFKISSYNDAEKGIERIINL